MCHVINIESRLKTGQIERIAEIENSANLLKILIEKNCPISEELDEAKKFLESFVAWARVAITRNN